MKKLLLMVSALILLASIGYSQDGGVEFHISVPQKYFQSYEEVPLDVFITNFDPKPKNITLTIDVGGRQMKYEFPDVEFNREVKKTILLPPQIPGRHVIKGRIYYGDAVGNPVKDTVPADLEVSFPEEIKSYPKRVIIASFEPPEKLYGGRSHIVKTTLKNEGDFETKILAELGTIDEFASHEITLKPGESISLNLNMTFYSTGIQFLESRIFYLEGEHKYLLNYFARESIVVDEKIADLRFDHLELYLEGNQEINQNDEVKLRVHIVNKGKFPATNVIGTLTGEVDGLSITKDKVNYGTIPPNLIIGGVSDTEYFEIKTTEAPMGEFNLNLNLNYIDNENRARDYSVPITIFEGDDKCTNNWDCKTGFFCDLPTGECQEVKCDCGKKTEHRCIELSDEKCAADQSCDNGVCRVVPCQCGTAVGHKCVIPDNSKCPDNQRCDVSGQCVEIECDGEIKEQRCDKKCYMDSECGEGEICNQYGRCDLGCHQDSDCKSNAKCGSTGFCEEIPCSCGEVINKQCVLYDCCSNNQCGEFDTCSPTIHKCVAQTGCIEVMKNGDSKDKLDVLFIGAEYEDNSDLKQEILRLMGLGGETGFFNVEPWQSLKSKFNIWMVTAPAYTSEKIDSNCSTMCEEALPSKRLFDSVYSSKCPFFDTTITIFRKSQFRSCAWDGQWSSLSCTSKDDAYRLLLHESGHSIGRLNDEYTDPELGDWKPQGPNCADNLELAHKLWGDLIGVEGVGFFTGINVPGTTLTPGYGCSYTSDNIRPTSTSIMNGWSSSYGPVNTRQIMKQLEEYE